MEKETFTENRKLCPMENLSGKSLPSSRSSIAFKGLYLCFECLLLTSSLCFSLPNTSVRIRLLSITVMISYSYGVWGYFQVLFSCMERLLCSLKVENVVLPAAEDAESIWTEKSGFRRMSEEQLKKYLREVQLTMFKGTSTPEKAAARMNRNTGRDAI